MFVRQAGHVLDLLEFFATIKRPATLAEISEHFGWPRSSTFNILSTLVEKGFLYEPRVRAGFYPSPRWLALSQTIVDAEPLPAAVYTLTQELMNETGETAVVAAPAGVSAIFVHVVESTEPIKYVARIGHRVPITATATGRAILSQYQPKEVATLLRRSKFERFTEATICTVEGVEKEMRASAKRGWYQNLGGHARDLFSVALPLPIESRRLAVGIAGPNYRLKDRIPELAEVVRRALKRHGLPTGEKS